MLTLTASVPVSRERHYRQSKKESEQKRGVEGTRAPLRNDDLCDSTAGVRELKLD